MKIIRYILPVLALVFSLSCSTDPHEGLNPPETRGVMHVEVTEKAGEEQDKLKTVRFFVFKNATSSPELELNERFDIPAIDPGDDQVSRFRIVLEVGKSRGVDDKLVVAILNEPSQMQNTLDAIAGYGALEELKLDFADFLNFSHSELLPGKAMPMTGAVWTDKVYTTSAEAENDPAYMTVHRAVARVDVYVRKEAGLDITLGPGTSVTLKNSYDRGFFVHNEDGARVFGNIQTVTSGWVDKSWTLAASDDHDLPVASTGSGRLLCSFYTPERSCTASGNADKLQLDIDVVTSEGAPRGASVILDKLLLDGLETDIDRILRNNAYRVIATVGANTITAKVLEWNSEEIETEF